jgi:hypothetical protein
MVMIGIGKLFPGEIKLTITILVIAARVSDGISSPSEKPRYQKKSIDAPRGNQL